MLYFSLGGSSSGFSVSSGLPAAPAFGVHIADNGLTTGFYGDLADRDVLFAASTVSVKRLNQLRNHPGPPECVSLFLTADVKHVGTCHIC